MSNRELMPHCQKGKKIQSLGCERAVWKEEGALAPCPGWQHPPEREHTGARCTVCHVGLRPPACGMGLAKEPKGCGSAVPSPEDTGSPPLALACHCDLHPAPYPPRNSPAPALPAPQANTAPSLPKT